MRTQRLTPVGLWAALLNFDGLFERLGINIFRPMREVKSSLSQWRISIKGAPTVPNLVETVQGLPVREARKRLTAVVRSTRTRHVNPRSSRRMISTDPARMQHRNSQGQLDRCLEPA